MKNSELEMWVCCRENGDKIEKVSSVDVGHRIIAEYEAEDRVNGIYQPNFYSIEVFNLEHTQRIVVIVV